MLRHIPNLITVLRIVLVIPICWLIWQDEYRIAFIFIFIAGISDGLDGFLARRFDWTSRLGALLDPAADKLLLISCFIMLGLKAILPWWLVVVVVMRDLIMVIGVISYHFVTDKTKVEPSFLGKLNTVLLVILVLLALYEATIEPLFGWVIPVLTAMIVVTTVVSGISYVILWIIAARQETHIKKQQK